MSALFFSNNREAVLEAINAIDTNLLISFALVFVTLTLGGFKANYGRYTTDKLGPTVPGVVDWYMHSTALIGVAASLVKDNFQPFERPKAAILLTMFAIHYFNRSFIFALQMDPKKVKPIPVMVLTMGSGFCLVNGFLNSRYLTLVSNEADMNLLQLVFGSLLWLAGFYGNIWHDRRLLQLKRESGGAYVIPTGGLFEFISGANFFCEIIEWLGYAIACNLSYPSVTFFIVAACNIGPRGLHHHAYYLEKFKESYPKSRKAIIPFIL